MDDIDSRLILGLWRIAEWRKNPTEMAEFIGACIDLGIDTFDLADIYADYQCESMFGLALRADPTLRTRIKLISKCGIALVTQSRPFHRVKHYDTSAKHIIGSVENTLRDLGVDKLNLLLIHRPDPLMSGDEVADTFERLKLEGKVDSFGVSNFLPHQFDLLQSCVKQPLNTNQVEISLSHLAPFFDGTLDQCQKLGISPQAWSPLAGGALAQMQEETALKRKLSRICSELNMTQEQVAIAWLLRHPARIRPVIGSGNLLHIRSLVEAQDIRLDRQIWFELLQAAMGREVP